MVHRSFTPKHRAICLLGCGALCVVAFSALAQETKSQDTTLMQEASEPVGNAAVLDFQKPDKIIIDKPNPESKPKSLIAHELTHVVQQSGAGTGDRSSAER